MEFEGSGIDGGPVTLTLTGPHAKLAAVIGRGKILYAPPTEHKGQPIDDTLPLPVGRLGLDYLTELVAADEARSA